MVEINPVATDMAWCGLLMEEKSAAGDTMGEGKGGDDDRAVFINGLRGLGVNFVEEYLVGGIGTEVIDLGLEDASEILRSVDVEVLGAS